MVPGRKAGSRWDHRVVSRSFLALGILALVGTACPTHVVSLPAPRITPISSTTSPPTTTTVPPTVTAPPTSTPQPGGCSPLAVANGSCVVSPTPQADGCSPVEIANGSCVTNPGNPSGLPPALFMVGQWCGNVGTGHTGYALAPGASSTEYPVTCENNPPIWTVTGPGVHP